MFAKGRKKPATDERKDDDSRPASLWSFFIRPKLLLLLLLLILTLSLIRTAQCKCFHNNCGYNTYLNFKIFSLPMGSRFPPLHWYYLNILDAQIDLFAHILVSYNMVFCEYNKNLSWWILLCSWIGKWIVRWLVNLTTEALKPTLNLKELN